MKTMSEERPGYKEVYSDENHEIFPRAIIDAFPVEEYPSKTSNVKSAMEQLWRNSTNWF